MDLSEWLEKSYEELNVEKYELLYIYADLRGFIEVAKPRNKDSFLESIIKGLIAKGITIVIPTFTYTTKGEFHVDRTKPKLGALNKYIMMKKNSHRSYHPVFSYSALGIYAKEITNGISKSAFGKDSVLDRLLGFNTGVIHIGRPVEKGNTMAHYIEQQFGATYRYNKIFETRVYDEEKFIGEGYSALVRMRNQANFYGVDFRKAAEKLERSGLVTTVDYGHELTKIQVYSYKKAFELLSKKFQEDHRLFLGEGSELPSIDL